MDITGFLELSWTPCIVVFGASLELFVHQATNEVPEAATSCSQNPPMLSQLIAGSWFSRRKNIGTSQHHRRCHLLICHLLHLVDILINSSCTSLLLLVAIFFSGNGWRCRHIATTSTDSWQPAIQMAAQAAYFFHWPRRSKVSPFRRPCRGENEERWEWHSLHPCLGIHHDARAPCNWHFLWA